jgi:hypothetical protein
MKKLLGILVLGLLLISNTVEAKSKSIGNGLTINIPKKYKHFEINFKKLTSTFPAIKKMLDEDEIDKEEFESFGIGPNAKLLVIADNQKPIAILKKLFSSGGLEKIMKKDLEPLSNKYIEKFCKTNDCEKLSKLPEEEQAEIVAKIMMPAYMDLIKNKWKINQYAVLLIGESLSDDYIEEIETEYEDYQEESEEEKTRLIKELIEEWKEEWKEENENPDIMSKAAIDSFEVKKFKVGHNYKNEPYMYGTIIWNVPDFADDGKAEFIITTIDNKIFAALLTCYRNCNDTNKIFAEILEPTNLLKEIEKIGIIADDGDGLTKQLKDLNELYKSGALTKEEFEKAKKKLLN